MEDQTPGQQAMTAPGDAYHEVTASNPLVDPDVLRQIQEALRVAEDLKQIH
jgi:hypothetical protein